MVKRLLRFANEEYDVHAYARFIRARFNLASAGSCSTSSGKATRDRHWHIVWLAPTSSWKRMAKALCFSMAVMHFLHYT